MAVNYTGVITENFFVEAQYSERDVHLRRTPARSSPTCIDGTLMVDGTDGLPLVEPDLLRRLHDRRSATTRTSSSRAPSSSPPTASGSHDLSFGYDTFDDHPPRQQPPVGQRLPHHHVRTRSTRNGVVFPVLRHRPERHAQPSHPVQPDPPDAPRARDFVTNSIFLNDSWRLNDQLELQPRRALRRERRRGRRGREGGRRQPDQPAPVGRLRSQGRRRLDLQRELRRVRGGDRQQPGRLDLRRRQPGDLPWPYRGPSINTDPNGAAAHHATRPSGRSSTGSTRSAASTTDHRPVRSIDIPGGTIGHPGLARLALRQRVRRRRRQAARQPRHGPRRLRPPRLRRLLLHPHRPLDRPGDHRRPAAAPTSASSRTATTASSAIYDGLHTQAQYRFSDRLDLGGIYTWSHLRGNFDGETAASGPVPAAFDNYPEYKDAALEHPERRPRARPAPPRPPLGGLRHLRDRRTTRSTSACSRPTPRACPTAPSARVNSRGLRRPTPATRCRRGRQHRLLLHRPRRLPDGRHHRDRPDAQLRLPVAACSARTSRSSCSPRCSTCSTSTGPDQRQHDGCTSTRHRPAQVPFNPFTKTPVEGVHWRKGPNFGKPAVPRPTSRCRGPSGSRSASGSSPSRHAVLTRRSPGLETGAFSLGLSPRRDFRQPRQGLLPARAGRSPRR